MYSTCSRMLNNLSSMQTGGAINKISSAYRTINIHLLQWVCVNSLTYLRYLYAICVWNKPNSAKHKKDDIVSESAYVRVTSEGVCVWMPSFPWSESHCSMDITWFPFDKQRCDLVYESWWYNDHEVRLTTHFNDTDGTYERPHTYSDFQPNDQWELIGKSFL